MPQARSGPADGDRHIDYWAVVIMAAYGLANVILWNATVSNGRFLFGSDSTGRPWRCSSTAPSSSFTIRPCRTSTDPPDTRFSPPR